MEGRTVVDMTSLGYEGIYYTKISDEVFDVEELIGAEYFTNKGHDLEINESYIDSTTYPGVHNIDSAILICYDQDAINTALGLPEGYITNGVYFVANTTQQVYTARFTSKQEVKQIDGKYLPDYVHDINNLATVAKTGSYTDLSNKPTIIGRAGTGSKAECFNHSANKAEGDYSHAEGDASHAEGNASHTEGYHSHAEGEYSHAEGYNTHAEGGGSHTEGSLSHAEGSDSHAEGSSTHAEGYISHAEGSDSHAEGEYSHTEGYYSHAEGESSHAEGKGDFINFNLTGDANATVYTNNFSLPSQIYIGMTLRMRHYNENVVGITYSTAKVVSFDTTANTITVDRTLSDAAVTNAKTIGYYTGMALSDYTHVEGNQNIAAGASQHVQGEFNVQDPEYDKDDKGARGKYAHIVGNGTSHEARSNAHTLDWDDVAWFAGGLKVGGTSQDDEAAKNIATEDYVNTALSNFTEITSDEINEICGINF